MTGGRVAAVRRVPTHAGAAVEISAGAAEARAAAAAGVTHDPDAADELLLVASFVRRPPPEVSVLPLDEAAILAECARASAIVA